MFNPKRILFHNWHVLAIISQVTFFSEEPLWLAHLYGQYTRSMQGHHLPAYYIHTSLLFVFLIDGNKSGE